MRERIAQLRRERKAALPLTFEEFTQLFISPPARSAPHPHDFALYHDDPILSLGQAQIAALAAQQDVSPKLYRETRRLWVYQQAFDIYQQRIAYEAALSQHFAHASPLSPPNWQDYQAYLVKYHHDDVQPFFRPWALPIYDLDSKAHSYLAAGSGHGKSELIKVMLYRRLLKGDGVILFDPHGKMAHEVIQWKEFATTHRDKLVYFSPYQFDANAQIAPVINPLATVVGAKYLDDAVEALIACMQSVFEKQDYSELMKGVMAACVRVLSKKPDATLSDLQILVNNPQEPETRKLHEFARKVASSFHNDSLTRQINGLDTIQKSTRESIFNRLTTMLGNAATNACLVGPSKIDLRQEMDRGAFMVFNLSRCNDELGRFLLTAIQNAAMSREGYQDSDPNSTNKSVYFYIDEGDRYVSDALKQIYKQTRKFGLHMLFAQQQNTAAMDADMRAAILGNSAVRIVGGSGYPADQAFFGELVGFRESDRAAKIESLPLHQFYFRVRNKTTQAQVWPGLAFGQNNMSAEALRGVLEEQKAKYYRNRIEERRERQEQIANEIDNGYSQT